jgi:hypothetical protein
MPVLGLALWSAGACLRCCLARNATRRRQRGCLKTGVGASGLSACGRHAGMNARAITTKPLRGYDGAGLAEIARRFDAGRPVDLRLKVDSGGLRY